MSTLIVFANANTASNMSDRSGHRMNLQVQDSVHILIRRVLVLGNACRLNNLSMHVCMYVCMYVCIIYLNSVKITKIANYIYKIYNC